MNEFMSLRYLSGNLNPLLFWEPKGASGTAPE